MTIVAGIEDDNAEIPCTPLSDERRRAECDRLLRKFRALIKRLCTAYVAQREDAEDLEATVLMSACSRFHTYDPARGTFGTWIGTIARHEYSDMRRKAEREVKCLPNSALTERLVEQAPDHREDWIDDWNGEFNLSPLAKRAFELVKLQGLTCAEAGAILGRTEGSVRTYIWKARQKMRGVLA